jgi:hypothetical protein
MMKKPKRDKKLKDPWENLKIDPAKVDHAKILELVRRRLDDPFIPLEHLEQPRKRKRK